MMSRSSCTMIAAFGNTCQVWVTPNRQRQVAPHDLAVFEPQTAGDEILIPSQSHLVKDRIRPERGRFVAGQPAVREVEARTGGHLDETEVEPVHQRIEIMIEIDRAGNF